MKAFPWFAPQWVSVTKAIVVLGGALALTIVNSSAGFMIDLRVGAVSGSGSAADDKSVFGVDVGSVITLQVWAEITPDGIPVNNIYGFQRAMGSIVTTSFPATGGNVRGDMSPAVIHAPFNDQSLAGQVAELSVPADGSLDLGSNATIPALQFIIFRHDPTTPGERVDSNPNFYFVTNNVPLGATVNPLSGGGYEFLLGTADFTVNTILDESDPALSVNWQIPAFTTPQNRGQRAQWTDGDGIVNSGSAQASELFVGEPVEISAAPAPVPEPGGIVMLMVGATTLLTSRHKRS